MSESISANAVWRYDYIDHYRLDESIIAAFLNAKWGDYYNYFIKARKFSFYASQTSIAEADLAQRRGDEFRFWVPRTLDDVGPPFIPCLSMGSSCLTLMM